MWRRVLLVISLCLNIILLYSLIWGESGALAYREMKAKYASIKQRMDDIEGKSFLINKEISLLRNDQSYLEKKIRSRLNFVRNNEILYIFSSGEDKGLAGVVKNEAKN